MNSQSGPMTATRKRTPVVHIGMPKTATKTLQWRIFAQHSEIFYLGRFDGSVFQGRYRQYKACRDETVFRVMDEVAYRGFRNPKVRECRELLNDYLAENNRTNNIPVWSWESYATSSRQTRKHRARNLKGLFGEAKIIITIRHPVKLLESAFMQQLKRDNVGGWSRRGRGLFYSSIDKWVKRDFLREVSNHLDYGETVRMYVEQFGQENVRVLVFEDLLRDKENYYRQLCKFMNINLHEALDLVHDHVDNSGWTNIQLERLRLIDSSWWTSLKFRFADRTTRKKMLNLAKNGVPMKTAKKGKMEISQGCREQILARTKKDNIWLDQTYDLGLVDYDYYCL